ncbi:hypothetical protein N7486_005235 [Penicillium sp. IBT 16267x]|nr:hypothetical protein N7486_005235 [Penicillium sp. IBT 16267x]
MDPVAVEFYSQRAKVVNNFNRYRDLITQHASASYPEIANGLEDDMHTLEKLLRITSTRAFIDLKTNNCLEERVDRVNFYLADLKIAFECEEPGRILKNVLEIAGTQVGMFRLKGVTDYHADEMILKAKELTEKYRPKWNHSIESYYYLKKMWKDLNFSRILCNCCICEHRLKWRPNR